MPLGDPGGGMFEYTVEGLPSMIKAVTISVSDVPSSVRFYCSTLKMRTVSANNDAAILEMGGSYVILAKGLTSVADTGIYLGVIDPFEFHRRMTDDGVIFARHPERGIFGVYASFRDPDGNIVHAVETTPANPAEMFKV